MGILSLLTLTLLVCVLLPGIDADVLKAHAAEPFRAMWPHFTAWLQRQRRARGGDGPDGAARLRPVVLVAHNAPYDLSMVQFCIHTFLNLQCGVFRCEV